MEQNHKLTSLPDIGSSAPEPQANVLPGVGGLVGEVVTTVDQLLPVVDPVLGSLGGLVGNLDG